MLGRRWRRGSHLCLSTSTNDSGSCSTYVSKSTLRGFTSFLLLSQIHNLLLAFPLSYYADDSEPYAGSNTKLAHAMLCYLSIHQSRAFHPLTLIRSSLPTVVHPPTLTGKENVFTHAQFSSTAASLTAAHELTSSVNPARSSTRTAQVPDVFWTGSRNWLAWPAVWKVPIRWLKGS